MPGEFVNVPEETDPDVIAQDIYEYLQSKVATWEPDDAEPDTWMINAVARILATLKDMASEARIAIFRFMGAFIFNLPPLEATRAVVKTTWKLVDKLGHEIPPGTYVGVPTAGGQLIPFETINNVIVPIGNEETTAGQVELQAVEPGAEATGLGTVGTVATLEDQYPWVAVGGITLTAATTGGQNEENDSDYLNRLVEEIRLWAPMPITPENFSTIARNIPGVGRAVAINLYNPVTKTFGNAGTITLALENGEGAVATAPVKAAVLKYLEERAIAGMSIFVIDPTFEEIDVEYEVTLWPGWEEESAKARCNEAIQEFLNPVTWGLPPFGDRKTWYNREKVKINDLIAALGIVQGVKDVVKVKIRKHATGAYEALDITLEGVAPLTKAAEIVGVV